MKARLWILIVLLAAAGGWLAGNLQQNPNFKPPWAGTAERRTIDAFNALVYRHTDIWDHLTWLGVHAQQNPNDVWMYQEIFSEVKPDLVIEAGANHGGGALVWATLLTPINPEAKVLTIDIEDKLAEARKVPLFNEKVEFFLGSSVSPEVFGPLEARAKDKKVAVILDSNHAKDHVLKEMMLYGDLVSVGSYLLVQDSNVNGHPAMPEHGPGPYEAIEAFFAQGGKSQHGATFEIDKSRERLLLTMHPNGYLKRIK